MTFEKLYDLNTILTEKEIEELKQLCYELGNSAFPIDVFFNDIRNSKSETYNKNQAYKDLWLVVLEFIRNDKKLKALEIIKRTAMKLVSLEDDTTICKKGRYAFYDGELYKSEDLTQEEYDLLKEVLL